MSACVGGGTLRRNINLGIQSERTCTYIFLRHKLGHVWSSTVYPPFFRSKSSRFVKLVQPKSYLTTTFEALRKYVRSLVSKITVEPTTLLLPVKWSFYPENIWPDHCMTSHEKRLSRWACVKPGLPEHT